MKKTIMTVLTAGLAATALATVELKDGVLTFDVASGTESYSASIAGVTEIVKRGGGKGYLQLGANTASGFTGKVTIEQGTMGADDLLNWGTPSSFEIRNGGALDLAAITGHSKSPVNLQNVPLTVSGSGVNGSGAIFLSANNGGSMEYEQLFGEMKLGGDAVLSSVNRWTIRGTIDFAGHTLTHIGSNMFSFEGVGTVLNPGRIVNQAGTFNIGGGSGLSTAEGEVVLEGGTFSFWNSTSEVKWPFLINKTSTVNSGWGTGTRNTIAAPFVHTNGTLSLTANEGATLRIKDASLTTTDAGFPDGSSTVAGPYLQFSGQGGVVLDNVAVTNALTKTKSECIDIRSGTFEWTAPGKRSVVSRIGCTCTNAWIHDAGHIDIISGKQGYVENGGRGSANPPKMTIENTTMVGPYNTSGSWYGNRQTTMIANSLATFHGQLVIGEGAVYTNGLRVGGKGQGTLYQRGGELGWLSTDPLGDTDLSSGCFYQSGGHCARLTDHRLAGCGDGFHRQTGGTFEQVAGDSVYIGFYGYAEMAILGGTYRSAKQHTILAPAWDEFKEKCAAAVKPHPEAQFTVSGANTLFDNSENNAFWLTSATQAWQVVCNFNDGGVFRVKRVGRSPSSTADAKLYVNLNGGVFRFALANIFDVRNNNQYNPDAVTLYEKGVVLDTAGMAEEDMDRTHPGTDMCDRMNFNWPLTAATGKGVTAIALPTDAAFLAEKFAGPTHVKVVDPSGAGYGASAIMDWDPETGRVKGIIVTAHGCNYGPLTYATLDSATGYTKTYPCAVTLADNARDGGIVKRGPFDVWLLKPGTFTGGITVEEGWLKMATDSCIPNGNAITLKGGGFGGAWSGFKLTVPTVTGYGEITNVTLTVTEGLSVSAADLLAGRSIAFRHNSTLNLSAGASLALTGYEALSEADKAAFEEKGRFSLVTFSKAYTGGIPAATGLPAEWRMRLTKGGRELFIVKRHGLAIMVK